MNNWQTCESCDEEYLVEVVGIKQACYCPVCGTPQDDPNGDILDEDYITIAESE